MVEKHSKSSLKKEFEKYTNKFENKLESAKPNQVVTRFPPEPSGYLHIGHIRALLINRFFADLYDGKMLVRFDDTNPEKEKIEFVDNILNDIRSAGIPWENDHSFVTDNFEYFEEVMTKLIKKGKCYCDNTPVDQMRENRDKGIPSKCRDNTIEKNIEIWNKMKDKNIESDSPYKKYCVRAKTDNPKDKNKCMRDPTFYRFCEADHYRLGTKYKLYPMYDFVCPIIDHKDGVTHMLRSNEYADRIPMYRWVEEAAGLPTMNIYQYARLNLVNTALSKRQLKWFVENKFVEGWDDPRFPTLRGIFRRGVKMEAIKDFILDMGPSEKPVTLSWDKLYSFNKAYIDPVAKRLLAVDAKENIEVEVTNFKEVMNVKGEENTYEDEVNWHPKNNDIGKRKQLKSNKLLIEKADGSDLKEGMKFTLYKWGNTKIEKVDLNSNNEVCKVYLKLTPEDKDFKNTKVAHWVSAKEGHVRKIIN